MPPVVPAEISHWSRIIIDDVAFMANFMDVEMDLYEVCAVLRFNHPCQRYIKPSDVVTIQEWLNAREAGYGGLKEEVKHLIATLGESKMNRWREGVEASLSVAQRKGWDEYDMFEEEDPRPKGEAEKMVDQFRDFAIVTKDTPRGVVGLRLMEGEKEAKSRDEEPMKAVELVSKAKPEIQGGRKVLLKPDWRRKEMEGILKGMAKG